MTPDERTSYVRQFDQAKARLPRGHVINHCHWQNGRLQVQHAKPERVTGDHAGLSSSTRRGALQQELFGAGADSRCWTRRGTSGTCSATIDRAAGA